MTTLTLGIEKALHDYLLQQGMREHACLRALRQESDALEHAGMRSSAEQMALLQLLIELTGAQRVLEVGCFTGYGTLAMALALPNEGRVISLDVNEDWASIGRRRWRDAEVAHKIDLRIGLAEESMQALVNEGCAGSFDLVYIDADKKGYERYYELALSLARQGALIAVDNVLWRGEVADASASGKHALILRAFNRRLHEDVRVSLCMLPIGDGLTLARKR